MAAMKPKKKMSDPVRTPGGPASSGNGGSVKVVKAKNPEFNKSLNKNSTNIANSRKSGEFVKITEKNVTQSKPAKVVKIDSGKTRAIDKAMNPGLKNKEQSAMRRGEEQLARKSGNKGTSRTINTSESKIPVKKKGK